MKSFEKASPHIRETESSISPEPVSGVLAVVEELFYKDIAE